MRVIDVGVQATNGTLWAIQAKAYAPDNTVTKRDMDIFLPESACPEFDCRLLITTTRHVSQNMIRASRVAEKLVSVGRVAYSPRKNLSRHGTSRMMRDAETSQCDRP